MTLVVSILSNKDYTIPNHQKNCKIHTTTPFDHSPELPPSGVYRLPFDHYYTENDCQPPYSFPYYHQQDLVKNKTPQQQ